MILHNSNSDHSFSSIWVKKRGNIVLPECGGNRLNGRAPALCFGCPPQVIKESNAAKKRVRMQKLHSDSLLLKPASFLRCPNYAVNGSKPPAAGRAPESKAGISPSSKNKKQIIYFHYKNVLRRDEAEPEGLWKRNQDPSCSPWSNGAHPNSLRTGAKF